MKVYQTNEIKNIALLGSSVYGKTTLVEAMLFESGVIKRRGSIAAKNISSGVNMFGVLSLTVPSHSTNVKGSSRAAVSTTVAVPFPLMMTRMGEPWRRSTSTITCRHWPQG